MKNVVGLHWFKTESSGFELELVVRELLWGSVSLFLHRACSPFLTLFAAATQVASLPVSI